jgi:hypothetical protein
METEFQLCESHVEQDIFLFAVTVPFDHDDHADCEGCTNQKGDQRNVELCTVAFGEKE